MSQYDYAVSAQLARERNRKHFTLAEAKRALPLVKRVAVDVQAVQAQRLRIHAELSAGIDGVSSTKQKQLQDEFERATDRPAFLAAGPANWPGSSAWCRRGRSGRSAAPVPQADRFRRRAIPCRDHSRYRPEKIWSDIAQPSL